MIASAAEWAAFWARHASNRDPPPELPAVDFATERVLAVSLGSKNNGCWSVDVSNVTRVGGEVVANVTTIDAGGPTALCVAAITQPYHFVAIEDATAPVRFEERLERPNANAGQGEPLSVRTLDRGSFSDIHEDTRVLLRDAAAWEALWARHRPNQTPPRVEFPNESVVAVVEHGPTGCFGIRLGNVSHDSATRVLRVEVIHVTTPPHVACIAAMQDAYEFAAIPDREGAMEFVDLEETGGEAGPGAGPGPESDEALRTRELATGTQSGIEGGMRALIRDEAAWRDAWARHASIQAPAPERPAVDFANESVVAVVLTDKPSGCWSVGVGNVTREAGAIRVEVVTRAPPPGVGCAAVITRPFAFAAIPASEGEATFVDANRAP